MRRHGAAGVRGLLLAALIVATSAVDAAVIEELKVTVEAGVLEVSVRASALLDPRTRSTIESGLPGSGVLEIRLELRGGGDVRQHLVERSLRLDLWRDRYLHRSDTGTVEFTSLAAADSAWSRFDRIPIVRLDQLDAEREYRVHLALSVEPLRPEDRGRVSRFVSQSSRDREEFRLDLSSLFRRWFSGAREREGADATSAWFKPGDLRGPQ